MLEPRQSGVDVAEVETYIIIYVDHTDQRRSHHPIKSGGSDQVFRLGRHYRLKPHEQALLAAYQSGLSRRDESASVLTGHRTCWPLQVSVTGAPARGTYTGLGAIEGRWR